MAKLTCTFKQLVCGVDRWAEQNLGLQLRNFIPGDTEVIMQDQYGRLLTLSVSDKGVPSAKGELAALIDLPQAVTEQLKREADEAEDLRRANLKELEDAAAVASKEQGTED